MRTIVAGSRTINDPEIISEAIRQSGFQITELVSGGARGVDRLGEAWARRNGVPIRVFRADWKRYGRGAGVLRNTQMAEYADALVAVWDGESRGTLDMIQKARKLGLKVFVFRVEGEL
ncbi:Protein of unknown function [Desulfacinum infernum DSM 9756]|uniref:YspA cpYpsA-related SLOG domain-containing protein n=1 Tax=Desulfacinum infernum DSM 9756 TaxID=1121391 RepID=A0A1M5IHD2_9BACT|nr:Protein of unknown function [Desulfacinum infernum DSM 9756]